MTAKNIFEYALVELNKVQAPSLLLEDYNYFINKAVNQYINKIYNAYEVNQQKSDDLRVLKGTTILPVNIQNDYNLNNLGSGNTFPAGVNNNKLFGATYETYLPDDYLHILNCIAEFEVKKQYKCYDSGTRMHFGVKKLTSDMFSQIINNYYMRPSYKNPYFFINNVNTNNNFPTRDNQKKLDEVYKMFIIENDGATEGDSITVNGIVFSVISNNDVMRTLVKNINESNAPELEGISADFNSQVITIIGKVELIVTINGDMRMAADSPKYLDFNQKLRSERYGNKSKVRMEIRYGKDNTVFELKQVYVDYLKSPQFIRLTQDEVDEVEDNSQLLEFPDYVCQEIINELIKLLMENSSDPRLQTNIPINQSIAQPQQEQQQKR